jgi:hypothetical protein
MTIFQWKSSAVGDMFKKNGSRSIVPIQEYDIVIRLIARFLAPAFTGAGQHFPEDVVG